MKILFTIFFAFLGMILNAQTCDSIMKYKEDKFNDANKSWHSDPVTMNSEGKGLVWGATFSEGKNKYLNYAALIFIIKDRECIDDNPSMIFIFEDGTKKTYYGSNEFNCDGSVMFSLPWKGFGSKTSREIIKQLSEKRVTDIRISTRKSYFDFIVPEPNGLELREALQCINTMVSDRE